jgi:hypothetical protein
MCAVPATNVSSQNEPGCLHLAMCLPVMLECSGVLSPVIRILYSLHRCGRRSTWSVPIAVRMSTTGTGWVKRGEIDACTVGLRWTLLLLVVHAAGILAVYVWLVGLELLQPGLHDFDLALEHVILLAGVACEICLALESAEIDL